ncbi:MAG: cell envelope integrity protein CreD [Bacteroidales bacterium]|nr:cell envelope integrity protein CreD [Bacteroidales bacterium]
METNKFQGRQALKLLFVAGLSLLLLIPLEFLKSTIRERKNTAENAITEVGSSWGGRQSLTGPYIEFTKTVAKQKEEQKKYLCVFPESFNADIDLTSSTLKRGIFKVPVYRSNVKAGGAFTFGEEVKDFLTPDTEVRLCLGLGDLKGLEDQAGILLGGQSLKFSNRVKSNGHPELVAVIPEDLLNGKDSVEYSLLLNLKGAASFNLAPVGETNVVKMTSDWPDPSFSGAFLPSERNVDENGFSAVWRVNALNRDYPQVCETGNVHNLTESSLSGVGLITTLSQYRLTERACKYALLIILITMLAIFLMEIWTGKKVNYLQYILTGADLVIFYTLLFSFAEHIGFTGAFWIAALMTIVLMVLYMKSVLGSWKNALALGGLATLLYAYIFVLLKMGDFAFLAGSIGLFILLAILMYFSQKAFSK